MQMLKRQFGNKLNSLLDNKTDRFNSDQNMEKN